MLSQKINLLYYRANDNSIYHDTLVNTYQLWYDSHYALLQGSSAIALPPIKNKEAIALLKELTPIIEENKDVVALKNITLKSYY